MLQLQNQLLIVLSSELSSVQAIIEVLHIRKHKKPTCPYIQHASIHNTYIHTCHEFGVESQGKEMAKTETAEILEGKQFIVRVPELTIIFRFGFRHFCLCAEKNGFLLFSGSLVCYAECDFGEVMYFAKATFE